MPVHADPAGIRRLSAALAGVDYPAEQLQVVVAVDGADPDTCAAVLDAGHELVTLADRTGSYAARNAALDRVRDDAEIVVFTDADCIPQPGWLRGHVAALVAPGGSDLSGGAITVTLRDEASPAEFVDRLRHLHQEHYVTRDGYAATANLAVRRAVVDAQRFDSRLQTGGDVEFCHRATAAGVTLAYSPDAEVHHPARQTRKELFTKVDRIVGGVRARPERWNGREIVKPRPRRALVRMARSEGVSRGLAWEVEVVVLEYLASRRLYRAVQQIRRQGLATPPVAESSPSGARR